MDQQNDGTVQFHNDLVAFLQPARRDEPATRQLIEESFRRFATEVFLPTTLASEEQIKLLYGELKKRHARSRRIVVKPNARWLNRTPSLLQSHAALSGLCFILTLILRKRQAQIREIAPTLPISWTRQPTKGVPWKSRSAT